MSWAYPKLIESNRSRPSTGNTVGLTGQVKVSFGLQDVSDADLAFIGNRRLLLDLLALRSTSLPLASLSVYGTIKEAVRHGSKRRLPKGKEWRKEQRMYISRLAFHTVPGKTGEVEQHLLQLQAMVLKAGGIRPRVSRAHFASLGAPDVVFEQDVPDLATLESQLTQVTESAEFHQWTQQMSGLLTQSPKREVYQLVD